LECAMSALVNQAQGFLSTGVNPERLGNDHPSIFPYGPVKTADGYLLLAVGTDAQWESLVRVLGDARLVEHEWTTNAGRVAARDALGEILSENFMRLSTDEWLSRLATAGVPSAPILDVKGAFGQDQVTGGDFVGTMSTPGGETRAMKTPLRVDGQRPGIRRGPRALGEDSEELLGSVEL